MTDYKTPQPLNQGSVKLSEVSMDTASDLLQSPIHDSALKVTEQLLKVTADLLRRQSFFLRSEGQMKWDGNTLFFDESSIANNIALDILQTENSSQPIISIKMNGATSAPAVETEFNSIALADGEMLYLELDPAIVAAAGTLLTIENSVDFPLSAAAGKRLVRTTIAAGLPTATSPVDQTPDPTPASTTYYLPLVARRGSYLQWIPHGISWPAGTSSPLGAVIVEGFQAYPDLFADSFLQFTSKLIALDALGGGVLLLTNSFGISASVTIPSNVTVLGRGAKTVLTVAAGAQIIMSENSTLENLKVAVASDFSGDAIHMLGSKRAKLKNVVVDVSAAVDQPLEETITYNAAASVSNKFGSTVLALLALSDGSVILGGHFTNYNGTAGLNYLVKLNSDGTPNTTFNTNASLGSKFNNSVYALSALSDGSILVGGSFTNYNGQNGWNNLIKLSSTGIVNSTFSSNTYQKIQPVSDSISSSIRSIAVDSSNNIYTSGQFSFINNSDQGSTTTGPITKDSFGNFYFIGNSGITIYKTDVNRVTTVFASGFTAAMGITIDSSDNLYVSDAGAHVIKKITSAGVVSIFAGASGVSGYVNNANPLLARFNGPRGLYAVGVDDVYVADTSNHVIRRVTSVGVGTAVGAAAPTVASGYVNSSTSTSVRFNNPSGVVVIPGMTTYMYVTDTSNHVIRRTSTYMGSSITTTVAGAAAPTVASGYVNNATSTNVRFNTPLGIVLDSSVSPYQLYITDSNNYVVRKIDLSTGATTTLAGAAASTVASGYVNSSISTNVRFSYPYGITLSSGSLYVSDGSGVIRQISTSTGSTITYSGNLNGYVYRNLVKLSSAGVTDATYSTNTSSGVSFNEYINASALDSSNNLYIAGNFSDYKGVSGRSKLIKVNSSGVLDTSFCANASDSNKFNGSLQSVAVQADGKLLVGGYFSDYDAATVDNLVRLNVDGTADTSFYTNASIGSKFTGYVNAIKVQSDGKILIGGAFLNYDTTTGRDFLLRLNSSGSLDLSTSNPTSQNFYTNAVDGGKLNNAIYSIGLSSSNNILLGGDFTNYSVAGLNRYASILPYGTTLVNAVNVTGIRVESNNCRMYECWFKGVSSAVQRLGINYVAGYTDNADVDSLFE
jgi:uncharacterized delta-60 repeat protein